MSKHTGFINIRMFEHNNEYSPTHYAFRIMFTGTTQEAEDYVNDLCQNLARHNNCDCLWHYEGGLAKHYVKGVSMKGT